MRCIVHHYPTNEQCITVRDVDLCTDDVSRLRQAWGDNIDPGADDGCVSSDPSWLSSHRTIANRRRSSTDFDKHVGGDGGGDAIIDAGIRLVFAGKDLQRGRPLLGYGLQADSTVHVLGRLRGGAQLGKVVKGRSQVGIFIVSEYPLQHTVDCIRCHPLDRFPKLTIAPWKKTSDGDENGVGIVFSSTFYCSTYHMVLESSSS